MARPGAVADAWLIPAREHPPLSAERPADSSSAGSPRHASVAPGRLNLLAELAGRLADAPVSAETFQAIAEGSRAGTVSAAAELRVAITTKEQEVFRAGVTRPSPGRELSVRLQAGNVAVGELTVWREHAYRDADRLFLETISAHIGAALDSVRMRDAQRQAEEPFPDVTRAAFGRLRRLFGGAVDRAVPAPLETPGGTQRRLGALSDDLVTLARLEVSETKAPELVPVASWLHRVSVRGMERAEAAERALLCAGSEPDLSVCAVVEHLEAAVDHLIANALSYSPRGSAVTLSAEESFGEVLIHVDDEGPGIAPAERERVFERFYRGRAAAATDVPGNGLGLAIVAQVAAAHGGRVSCGPSPTGGARFTMALPAV